MRREDKYIVHDPEVHKQLIDVLTKASMKNRTRFGSDMLFYDVQRYIYYTDVWHYTEEVEGLVFNHNIRGNEYHLDHIIPLSYGYTYNIDPKIIGSFFNLQVIHRRENLAKGQTLTDQAKELLKQIDYDTTYYPKPTKIVYDNGNPYNNYNWEDRVEDEYLRKLNKKNFNPF